MNSDSFHIKYLDEFKKEFKQLCKKFHSLEKDFLSFLTALKHAPNSHIVIDGLGNSSVGTVYKVKRFRCQSISKNANQSGIRIIYCYNELAQEICFAEITFVEIYYKGDKENEDRERIKRLFGQ